jgi:uncharacterized protein YqgV (UPF0045/DUF77 family)
MKGEQKMINEQLMDTQKVLVELSVIPLSGNGQTNDRVDQVLNIVDETGLLHERTHNGTCIEGDWNDISALIYTCYQRVQEQYPQGFLKVSIR